MLVFILNLCIFVVSLSMTACLIRFVKGSSVADRLMAIDSLFLHTVSIVVLLGIAWRSDRMFESALLIMMLGFISTLATARYIANKNIIE